jgi:hypothetical protein
VCRWITCSCGQIPCWNVQTFDQQVADAVSAVAAPTTLVADESAVEGTPTLADTRVCSCADE